MIVDSSAVVAIVLAEADHDHYLRTIATASSPLMSAGNYVECGIVIDGRRDPSLSRELDDLLNALSVAIEPVTAAQARIARQAYREFGKGSGHKAGLNFGDCFAYALAIDKRQPLLFKGDDFGHTDVKRAIG